MLDNPSMSDCFICESLTKMCRDCSYVISPYLNQVTVKASRLPDTAPSDVVAEYLVNSSKVVITMGAQEVAAIVSILVATPVAALYSIVRWDASRYLVAPEMKDDIETDQTKNKPTPLQECLRFLCFLAFMATCWGAGWSLQYLPAALRDLGIISLMCGFPVSRFRFVQ